jgi:hypothetical protein
MAVSRGKSSYLSSYLGLLTTTKYIPDLQDTNSDGKFDISFVVATVVFGLDGLKFSNESQ